MRLIVIPQSRVVEVWDQNLHGSKSNIDQIYEGEKGDSQKCLKVETLGFGTKTCMVPNLALIIYKGGNLRSVTMPLGRDQILLSPGKNIDRNLHRENNYDDTHGKGNNQNLYGYHPTRDNINITSERTGSYQSLTTNYQVLNPDRAGLDLHYQGAQGGFSSHPIASQFASKPRAESNSIDFSQSLTQILSFLRHNLNANTNEGFAIVSACADIWKETMTSRHNNQEERILGLEHNLLVMTNTIQGSQTSFLELQAELRRMDEMVTQHETIIPRLRLEVESSSRRVNSVLSSVEERMKEFEVWINEIRWSNMEAEISMEIVNSLNKIIQESAPSVAVEIMQQQVKELSRGIQCD